jgi:hypothetical protein
MFQATFNGKIIADGKTMRSLRNDFVHEAVMSQLDFTLEDCDIAEYLVGGDVAADAHQISESGSAAERFLQENRTGFTEDTLLKFCQDGHTSDEDLGYLVDALYDAGAPYAASLVLNFIGL